MSQWPDRRRPGASMVLIIGLLISSCLLTMQTVLAGVREECSTVMHLGRAVELGNPTSGSDGVRKRADDGDAMAMFALGFLAGSGDKPNYTEEANWYFKAAELQNPCAQNGLGVLYSNGWGVPKDPAEAARWYRMAADQGHSQAQYNLGVLYREGYGVSQDNAEAVKWFKKSADQGNKSGRWALDALRSNSPDQTPQQ